MVETNGQLVRACATAATAGMEIFTNSEKAGAAQREAFDRILTNHVLYCTVCDNNNGNCTIHNTERLLGIEHQPIPNHSKPYEEELCSYVAAIGSRVAHAGETHPPHEDSLYVLRCRMQL